MIITNNKKDLIDFGKWYNRCLLMNMHFIQKPMSEVVDLYYDNKDYFKNL